MGLIFISEEIENYFLNLQPYWEKCEYQCKDTLLAIEALQENEQLQTKAWKAASERLLEIHNGIIAGFYMVKDAVQESMERFHTIASNVADDDKDCVWREECIITLIQTLREDEERILQQLEELYAIQNARGNDLWRIAPACMEGAINAKLELLENVRRAIAKLNDRLENLYEMENMTKGLLEVPQDILYALEAALQAGKVLLTGEGECTDGSWKKVINSQEIISQIEKEIYDRAETIFSDKLSLKEINNIFGENAVKVALFQEAQDKRYQIYTEMEGNEYAAGVLSALSGYMIFYDAEKQGYYVNELRWIDRNQETLTETLSEVEQVEVDIALLMKGCEIEKIIHNLEKKSDLFYREKKKTIIAMGRGLLQAGYDEAFVAGMLGNIVYEANCGQFENANYSRNEPLPYIKIINDNIPEYAIVSNKNLCEVGIERLVGINESIHKENTKFGLGCIQWTPEERRDMLIERYIEVCGKTGFPTFEQCVQIELEWMNHELNDKFYGVYSTWKPAEGISTSREDARRAGKEICACYIIQSDKQTQIKRADKAVDIYDVMKGIF